MKAIKTIKLRTNQKMISEEEFYEDFHRNKNLSVNNDDLLFVKCKLFLRFKYFIKNINMNDSSNFPLLNCFKKIDIRHVPNFAKIYCEITMHDSMKLIDEADFKYIAISKLCCPLCYFFSFQNENRNSRLS